MQIKTDFAGANIKLLEESPGYVKFWPDYRDTKTGWFYWAFAVEGAQGQTWTFEIPDKDWLGYYGPAVSYDLQSWHWGGKDLLGGHNKFSYSFGPAEDKVYFAHHMLYQPARFMEFAYKNKLVLEQLTLSEKGRPVPLLRLGQAENSLLLTARHHCCESTANYVLEGMLEYFLANPWPGHQILALPFMDLDGVLAGDQGKNREPHDHNRDYHEAPIYQSTAALMDYTADQKIKYFFDLHAPWHLGGQNDTCFMVHKGGIALAEYEKLAQILASLTAADPASMQFQAGNYIADGVGWNSASAPTCAAYFASQPAVRLGCTFEICYFGSPDNQVSQERLVRFGNHLARALVTYAGLESGQQV